MIGSPQKFKPPVPSKLLLWKKYVLTAVDEILASFSTAVVLTPSTITANGTTISTVVTVLNLFSSWILTMVYATATALECAGARITGNTGSRNIHPLAPMGIERNENALLSLRIEAVVLIPVYWVCEVVGCCGCGGGASEI